jgi:hypothetical protein
LAYDEHHEILAFSSSRAACSGLPSVCRHDLRPHQRHKWQTYSHAVIWTEASDQRLRTGADGAFALSTIPLNQVCDVLLDINVGTQPRVIAEFELLDGDGLNLGALSVQSVARNLLAAHIVGPVTVAHTRGAPQAIAAPAIGLDGIHLIRADGERFFQPQIKDPFPPHTNEQTGYGSPQLSADRTIVGWMKETYCCTSYPVSLAVIVWRPGSRPHVLTGDGRAIFAWSFVAGGKQVAFRQDALHGEPFPNFELRDAKTEQLVNRWRGPLTSKAPGWAAGLQR